MGGWHINQTSVFSQGGVSQGIPYRSQAQTGASAGRTWNGSGGLGGAQGASGAKSVLALRRFANGTNEQKQTSWSADGIVGRSISYASSLQTSRAKAKDTSLQLKKLHYNFKSVSSQILRSKTSTSARQAASKARREVLRLKRQKRGGQYDEEEIQAAITHAQSMERVAKKKAAHLQQEELMKVSGAPGSVEERTEELKEHPEKLGAEGEGSGSAGQGAADVSAPVQAQGETQVDAMREQMRAEMEAEMEAMQEMQEAAAEQMMDELAEVMEELQAEVADQMQEMLDEIDMMEELGATAREVSPEDYKALVLKHRTDEMKEIAKADKDYLKALFNKYAKEKANPSGTGFGSSAGSASGSGPISGIAGLGSGGGGDLSVPSAAAVAGVAASAGAASLPAVSIDVSV